MKVVFSAARNGSLSCTINNKQYHSLYNPENEALSFCKNTVKPSFKPSVILIIEPGLSYCAGELKKLFPESQIAAVRLTDSFSEYDILWDKVFYFNSNSSISEELYNYFGEENLLRTAIYSWPQSSSILTELNNAVLAEIKKAVVKSRSVLYTREHFSKKWFLNSIKFFLNIRKITLTDKIKKDILITASGPSLTDSIRYIKEYRNNFFLIAVSSSLSVLQNNEITPDLVLSTDGGFWAKKHLSGNSSIFALTDESCISTALLRNSVIFPLAYKNSIGEKIFKKLQFPFFYASRNGTVSGTAAELALSLTDKKVYFCGLDLCPTPGFQHASPNNLEKENSSNDFRYRPKEQRLTISRFSSEGSLEIYRNWFTNTSSICSERFFRLSDNYKYTFTLGKIKDLNWKDLTLDRIESDKTDFLKIKIPSYTKNELKSIILDLIETDFVQNELFPLENLLINRSLTQEDKSKAVLEKSSKVEDFRKKIERFFNE